MYATIGILAALHHRSATGDGQYIDLALLDTQVGWLANQAQNYFLSGKSPVRTGAWHPNLAPYQPFNASDGPVIIAVGNDGQFGKLCAFIDKPELANDARFASNPDRNANRVELAAEIQAMVAQHPSAYWLENLPAHGVPCSPINTIEQAFADPQVQHRGMKIDLPHPLAGSTPGVANPLKFSETPIEYTTAPPLLGEHTEEILRAVLGQSNDDIETLKQRKIV
jgi:crotonobetainyl-CoA:carnitine CoA-transferase CaiB-like acyl-CoA transferase